MDSEVPYEPEPQPPGLLEARLDATATRGAPDYATVLRFGCTTNTSTATIEEVRLTGPLEDSPGYLARGTGLNEFADSMHLVIPRPARADLTCISSLGDSASAQLAFGGWAPEMNLDPLHATLARPDKETIIDLGNHVLWADSVWVEPLHPDEELAVEVDQEAGQILLRIRPGKEIGTVTIHLHAQNAFGSTRDNLLLNVTYPPGLVLYPVDWWTDAALPATITLLDEAGRVMAEETVSTGVGYIDVKGFTSPVAVIRVESDGYFTRMMGLDLGSAGQRIDLPLPVLPISFCRAFFADSPDPVTACLQVTRDMLFGPLDPHMSVVGYRSWPSPPSGAMLYSHAATGATLPTAWAVAVRESASRWRNLGVDMAVASRFSADVSGVVAVREESGRWTTNVKNILLFVPDHHDDAELAIHFREGPQGLHSAVISLPVLEPIEAWFASLEAVRIRAQLAVGTSSVYDSWEAERQNRFLTEWVIPIRRRDRSPFQPGAPGKGGFEIGLSFEEAFGDVR